MRVKIFDMKNPTSEQQRRWNRAYYLKSGATKIRRFSASYRERNQALMRKMKEGPCMDCGGLFHHVAMDFDHVRGIKRDHVASLAAHAVSEKVLLDEIAKCDLVCSNCHRIRTWNRGYKH